MVSTGNSGKVVMRLRSSLKIGGICSLLLTLLVSGASLSCLLASHQQPHRGDPLEKWETANGKFRIRVTAYRELGAYLSGTYYVFDSTQAGSDAWTEFMTVRHDDRRDLPREQVRFISDQIAYVFMGWKYAVTRDGGKNWSVWDAQNQLPNWRCCNYGLIQDLRIEIDGVGIMKLNPISKTEGVTSALQTKDFGIHWTENRD